MSLCKDQKDYLLHKGSEEGLSFYNKERERGVPHAYLAGKVVFFDLILEVSGKCLIPRMESEILVERFLKKLPERGRVLDLCTGSGALGLAIKKEKPALDVVLSDVSKEALQVARKNACLNNLDVSFVEGDFLSPFIGERFDAIICNPPYISEEEYLQLEKSVKDYEPKLALVGADNGLHFYKKLAESGLCFLKSSGLLGLEIGKDQGEVVKALFSKKGWMDTIIEKDYSAHDRFCFTQKEGA